MKRIRYSHSDISRAIFSLSRREDGAYGEQRYPSNDTRSMSLAGHPLWLSHLSPPSCMAMRIRRGVFHLPLRP